MLLMLIIMDDHGEDADADHDKEEQTGDYEYRDEQDEVVVEETDAPHAVMICDHSHNSLHHNHDKNEIVLIS